ncbi:MAG: hypothetical protein JJ850_07730 [Kordiimonadaceae bacterium]|nr:hypothetical protein [Kordiimonadaceae bacterium]MBO6569016.1 hypothetical protein [Kordiimonadaceae bacterium]MBO6964491.1 hypothetical protein [Kordiimonadaceae bacterium]
MTESHIDYDAKVQDALRSVVKTVLTETARDGLQGDHHFYVAFKTQAPGVNIPTHLVSRFPDEMTIVLQHKFWGLEVHDEHFEIGLSFNQKPEHLIIPFAAIVGFVDPSVQFALQFHDESEPGTDSEVAPEAEQIIMESDDSMFLPEADEEAPANVAPAPAEAELAEAELAEAEQEPEAPKDNVVTLDAFRKK